MSYITEGVVFLILGIFLLIFPILGIVMIVLSIMQISRGSQQIQPGSRPQWCKWNGHDWRRDIPGHAGSKVCRNCLKGANVNYGYPVGGYGYSQVAYVGGPAYAAPAGPGYAAPAGPGYAAPAQAVAPAPTPTIVPQANTYAAPAQQYCRECGLGVGPADATCPHCGKPPR